MAKSKEELIYDIENNLVDSDTGKITGENVKARLLDMVNAMGTGGGAMEYWSVPASGAGDELEQLLSAITYAKAQSDGVFVIGGFSAITSIAYGATPVAIAYDPTLQMVVGGEQVTPQEMLEAFGIDLVALGYTQITKEEFFSISTE